VGRLDVRARVVRPVDYTGPANAEKPGDYWGFCVANLAGGHSIYSDFK
jgi:hypothetical protein